MNHFLRAGSVALLLVALCASRGNALSFAPLSPSSKPGGPKHDEPKAPIDCSGAIPIVIGGHFCGTTAGAAHQVDLYGCSPWPETGGEVIFQLAVDEPTEFEIELESTCDLDLAVLSGCDPATDCLIVADTGVRSVGPVAGTFVLIVDGYNGAACDFCLDVRVYESIIFDPTACDTATPISCANATLQGTTCGRANALERLPCGYVDQAGSDAWYRVELGPGGTLSAVVHMAEADAAAWILTSCSNMPSCLAFADGEEMGGAEQVTYENTTTEAQEIFLVVDTFGAGNCGAYEVALECSGGTVPAPATAWGTLKAGYAPTVKRR